MRALIMSLMMLLAMAVEARPTVSLLTALPGDQIYELEGHTGLRILDPEQGVDVVVNWGLFDFNAPGFVYRFVKGETDYMCGEQYTDRFIGSYVMSGRQVVEQVLDLDSLQTERLIELVAENLQPQNRVYRYNYVKDNCATRPLHIIEEAVGQQLIADDGEPTTWRREMTAYHRNYPWYQFGIDLALGRGIDSVIHERGRTFAPVRLMADLEGSGLVSETRKWGEQTLHTEATAWWLTPQAAAWLILLIAAGLSIRDLRRGRPTRWFDTVLFGVFGLTGCVIVYLICISVHEATSPNLLVLWLNPVCLLGATLPWIKSAKKWQMWYFFANFALLMTLIVVAPLLGRHINTAFWPLIAADALRSLLYIKLLCTKANRT